MNHYFFQVGLPSASLSTHNQETLACVGVCAVGGRGRDGGGEVSLARPGSQLPRDAILSHRFAVCACARMFVRVCVRWSSWVEATR